MVSRRVLGLVLSFVVLASILVVAIPFNIQPIKPSELKKISPIPVNSNSISPIAKNLIKENIAKRIAGSPFTGKFAIPDKNTSENPAANISDLCKGNAFCSGEPNFFKFPEWLKEYWQDRLENMKKLWDILQLVLAPPTPPSGTVLNTDETEIRVWSIRSDVVGANLFVTYPNGISATFPMQNKGGSTFSKQLVDLDPGLHSFVVELVLQNGNLFSPTSLFTVPVPALTFISPTPANGSVIENYYGYNGDPLITISANKNSSSATLYVIGEDNVARNYSMTEYIGTGVNTFGKHIGEGKTHVGWNRYYVTVWFWDGSFLDTLTQWLYIPSPEGEYVEPTPENGSQVTGDVTVTIYSDEYPSASLWWKFPNGTTRYSSMNSVLGSGGTLDTYTVSNLEPGTHIFHATIHANGITANLPERSVIVQSPLELSLVSPTPLNNAALSSDSATVQVSSSEPLSSATLHLTKPDSSTVELPMSSVNPTTFSVSLTGLRAGANSYYVEGTSAEGVSAVTETRSFTVPLPVVIFVSPTPANGASQTSASVTIAVSSDDELSSATLHWTSASEVNTEYTMTATSSTSFSYSLLNLAVGTHSYFVEVVDNEGDVASTVTRTLVIEYVPTPPQLTFIDPTPANAVLLASDSATVQVSSSEALVSATLHLTKPDGSTTVNYPMSEVNSTTFSVSLTGLRAGVNTYYIEAVDVEGEEGASETRSFTSPLPIASFVSPTPVDSGVRKVGANVIIKISSNEPLANAVLRWTNPSGSTSVFLMSSTSTTEFIYAVTLNTAGNYTFFVEVTDDEGDKSTTATRTLVVTLPVLPPVVGLGNSLSTVQNNPLQFQYVMLNGTRVNMTFNAAANEWQAGEATQSHWARQGNTNNLTTHPGSGGGGQYPHPVVRYDVRYAGDYNVAGKFYSLNNGEVTYSIIVNAVQACSYVIASNQTSVDCAFGELEPGDYIEIIEQSGADSYGDYNAVDLTISSIVGGALSFVTPTPANGATLVNDSLTVVVSSSDPLEIATLSLFLSNGSIVTLPMSSVTPTTYSATVNDLRNGSVSYSVTAIDDQGNEVTSDSRTAVVPIAFQVHEFQGEAVASMSVFGNYMYVGTFNETAGAAGNSHVYRSADGINWQQVFTADQSNWLDQVTTSVTGVYSMATYDDGQGEALYIGTGSINDGNIDGDIYRSYDGTTWTRVFHWNDQMINKLVVIDGTLYATTRLTQGGNGGRVLWYNATTPWNSDYKAAIESILGIGKYINDIYYSSPSGALYRFGNEANGAITMTSAANYLRTFSSKFYMGGGSLEGNSLGKTTNPVNWEFENIPDSITIPMLRQLSDGYLYIPTTKLNLAKLWRKSPTEINELIADFSPKDRTMDIVDFNGRKYVGVVDRIGDSGTNRWGYIYKLTK